MKYRRWIGVLLLVGVVLSQAGTPLEQKAAETVEVETIPLRVMVIFEKLDSELMQRIEREWGLKVQRCLTKRLCIFRNTEGLSFERLKEGLEGWRSIREVIPYRQHRFRPF